MGCTAMLKKPCLNCGKMATTMASGIAPEKCPACSRSAMNVQRPRRTQFYRPHTAVVQRSPMPMSGPPKEPPPRPGPPPLRISTAEVPHEWVGIELAHFITPMKNLAGILDNGLLCHDDAQAASHVSLADEDVQARRENKIIPANGRRIHSCANLYFNPRNAMMYRLISHIEVSSLAIVNFKVADVYRLPGAVVSDRNAAALNAQFFKAPEGLSHLRPEQVYSSRWVVAGKASDSLKQAMMAEVLVPSTIPASLIQSVTVANQAAADSVATHHPSLTIATNGKLFFQ